MFFHLLREIGQKYLTFKIKDWAGFLKLFFGALGEQVSCPPM